jgi:hypothetical protein
MSPSILLVLHVLACLVIVARSVSIINNMHGTGLLAFIPTAALAVAALGSALAPAYGGTVTASDAALSIAAAAWVWFFQPSACPFISDTRRDH